MKKKEKQRVLLTAFGTSDPVRGYRDGAFLHILRYYRPEVLYIFITKEIAELDRKDNRLQITMDFIKEHWDGYAPEVVRFGEEVSNPAALDDVEPPLREALKRIQAERPGAEILLNLTSGTPQMQIVLAQFAAGTRYHATGIQVLIKEKKSGSEERTNSEDFEPLLALETSEDEEEYAAGKNENRCLEPSMFVVEREHQRTRLETLLHQRNYSAASELDLPEDLKLLARHLAARDQLQDAEARQLAERLQEGGFPFALYPARPVPDGQTHTGESYAAVSEYFLMLKNRHCAGQYTDFTLRLNPLVIQLQAALLDRYLPQDWGIQLSEILEPPAADLYLSTQRMVWKAPRLKHALDQKMKTGEVRDGGLSIFLCNYFLECTKSVPAADRNLFRIFEELNTRLRNDAAHTLKSVTEQDITRVCGMSPAALVRELEDLITRIYPACDPELFNIYLRCNQYMREQF